MVTKNYYSLAILTSTSIFHGLQSDPQSISKIEDYELSIYTPNNNVFTSFYESFCGEKWPFSKSIKIKLSDVLMYCYDITSELKNICNIETKKIPFQSLIRTTNDTKQMWFEILVHDKDLQELKNYLLPINLNIITFNNFTHEDKSDWLIAYDRTPASLINYSFLRTPISVGNENIDLDIKELASHLNNLSKNKIFPFPIAGESPGICQIFPRINLAGQNLFWHPIFSDYIMAFSLSSLLRYHPHIFRLGCKNSFIGEGWCSQSSITTLRHYLFNFTTPHLRIN